jgi:hypothetical protein
MLLAYLAPPPSRGFNPLAGLELISARVPSARSEGIAVERILSTPWCRCKDTATLLKLGPVEAEPRFGNVVVLSDQRESLTAGARAVIDK